MKAASIAGAGLAAVAGLGAASHELPPLALINATRSVPRGLYVRARDQRLRPGALVAVMPPPQARRYLSGLGMPTDTPLLKRVVATGGQTACRRGAELAWDGGAAPALSRDRRGARLPAWSGCRRLADEELLVLGDTPISFDSRYFGPVRRSAVKGVYREALRW